MSEVWPNDIRKKDSSFNEAIRPFKCLIMTPFDKQFDQVCDLIKEVVEETAKSFPQFGETLPKIERIDWVASSGVIQNEIWRKINESDLVFCNITGFNPNVMFELGVCAAWKSIEKVIIIKDGFFKQEIAFNISPIRHIEYEMTTNGVRSFAEKINALTITALISFPDSEGHVKELQLPLQLDFSKAQDGEAIYTPPYAHRRIVDDKLEFGSALVFSHSWATIGKKRIRNFSLEFDAEFCNIINKEEAYIGVGLRSQHYYANYGHILYLKGNGRIIITEPNQTPPLFYSDNTLRKATPIDITKNHHFKIVFNEKILSVEIDNYQTEFEITRMQKVFGEGYIRFQSYGCWMALRSIKLE